MGEECNRSHSNVPEAQLECVPWWGCLADSSGRRAAPGSSPASGRNWQHTGGLCSTGPFLESPGCATPALAALKLCPRVEGTVPCGQDTEDGWCESHVALGPNDQLLGGGVGGGGRLTAAPHSGRGWAWLGRCRSEAHPARPTLKDRDPWAHTPSSLTPQPGATGKGRVVTANPRKTP